MKWTIEHDSTSGAVWIEDETGQSIGVCDFYHRHPATGDVVHKPDFAKNMLLVRAAPEMRDALKEIAAFCDEAAEHPGVPQYVIAWLKRLKGFTKEPLQQVEPQPCHPDNHVWVTDSQSNGLIDCCIICGEERA